MPILKNSITAGNVSLAPAAIQAQRDPLASDVLYEIGQCWVNEVTNIVFTLTSFVNGVPTWTELDSTGGGGGVFSSLTVTPGPTAITGEFRVVGNVNEANVIRLEENGGATGTITIESLQGTSANSILIQSGAGGINVVSTVGNIAETASAGTITLAGNAGTAGDIALTTTAAGGGITAVTDVGGFNVNVTGDGPTSIGNNSSGGAVSINSTGVISLLSNDSAAGAVKIRATGAAGTIQIAPDSNTIEVDIANVVPAVSRLTYINGGTVATAVTDGVYIGDGATSTNASASKFVDIGTGNNLLGTTAVNIATGTTVSGTKTVTVGNADGLTGINLLGVVNVNQTGTGTTTIGSATGGAVVIDSGSTIDIEPATSLTMADKATVTTIHLGNITPTVNRTTTINGGIVNTAHVDLVSIADGGVSMSGSAEKEVTIATGGTATGLTLVSIATGNVSSSGNTTLNLATGNAPATTTQAINIGTGTGGGTKSISIGSATDSLTTVGLYGVVGLNNGTATGATTIGNSTSGGAVAVATNTAITMNSKTSSTWTVTGAAADLNLFASGGSVNISATEAVNDAITLASTFGGLTIDTFGAGAAGAIAITSHDALGSISLSTGAGGGVGGLISVGNNTVAAGAGPGSTVTVVNNARVGVLTFGGYTQTAASTLVVTLTNSFIAAGSCILASVTNVGSNDAQMHVTRIKPGTGTADITITNSGSAALNGNMQLNFWVLS